MPVMDSTDTLLEKPLVKVISLAVSCSADGATTTTVMKTAAVVVPSLLLAVISKSEPA